MQAVLVYFTVSALAALPLRSPHLQPSAAKPRGCGKRRDNVFYLRWLAVIGMAVAFPCSTVKASLCLSHSWTLNEIADAPILIVGHVVSLERETGPHFTGDPKRSAPEQKMTAEVEVLRFIQRKGVEETLPARRLKIRFIGRDGPDFSFCSRQLPQLAIGQTLLLPLRNNPKAPAEPWALIGVEGYGMSTRVAEKMDEPALAENNSRSFIIREFVNSFRSHNAVARFTAASTFALQGDYLEPELSDRLKRSIGNNATGWAGILGSILLSYPSRLLTLDEVEAGRLQPPNPRFKGLALAQLARSHLPERAVAERLIWRSLLADLPRLADEPYHPLFSYNSSYPLSSAVRYLLRYSSDPSFNRMVKAALRKDRPGSSALAASLITDGRKDCLPEALTRAMKVLYRPEADGSDVFGSIQLVLHYGNEEQRRRYARLVTDFKNINPDYVAFLQLKLSQSSQY
jgi:hypothetical protein